MLHAANTGNINAFNPGKHSYIETWMKKICLLFIFWAADYDYSFMEN